jgi:membrane fusion protein, heavy metal efflux system
MSSSVTAAASWAGRLLPSRRRLVRRGVAVLTGAMLLGAAAWWSLGNSRGGNQTEARGARPAPEVASVPRATPPAGQAETVRIDEERQRAIGLKTARVVLGVSFDVLTAPGRVAPNEAQYAYITPRAAGVVRSVTAHVGQDVKAGDLLATIDSPEVGEVRLELYTRLQALDIARAQASWQQTIYRNTLELIEHLQKGETPERIHEAFAERPVGENRERLMTAYAQYRLAVATIARERDLFAQELITPKQFQKVNADFEVAQANYQSLMDQMGFEVRLANTRAQQARKQAETAVRATQERLRILGVKPDGTEPEVEHGKVLGVQPDGTLLGPGRSGITTSEKPETILPSEKPKSNLAVAPVGTLPGDKPKPQDGPISTYSIWAPFDGTILDRETIVPGVAVDTTHRIFTMANLSTVWVEASVHEGDFGKLARSRGQAIHFRSPAYPRRVFQGEVTYAGDLVEEKSRTVKLLAVASNPDRLLKPGMFVEVEVFSPRSAPATQVPASALLTQGSRTFVYVRHGPDRFDRREVEAEPPRGDVAAVLSGLEPGEEVVVEGGFKLKALAVQEATAQR